MTEPNAQARKIVRVVPTVHRWRVHDDRIGGEESDAYAVVRSGRVTLIDPLPVSESELRRLGQIEAIVLTAANHQRSAWRYRRLFGVPVFAPEGPTVGPVPGQLEEEPDYRYSGGDTLPGGLVAFHAPGPAEAMYALWLDSPRSVVFLSDLLWHDGSGLLRFFDSAYQDEPMRTRASVRRIADHLPLEVLCFAHGPPICENARQALERALAVDLEERTGPSGYAEPP
ncbi:MAG: MBL fold metallo-hydrolase [Pseudomonadota bacterium]|mgnify:FL=1|nr:MAG: MBL fold metallo-hydrolase [Pseudomonadota bacterium]